MSLIFGIAISTLLTLLVGDGAAHPERPSSHVA
jgi:hypothetical protein